MSFSFDESLLFSSFIKEAQKTGFITSPTTSEEVNVTIRVIGRYFMNSPIIPGQKIIGANAQRVVSVDAITGIATSLVPTFAASSFCFPF